MDYLIMMDAGTNIFDRLIREPAIEAVGLTKEANTAGVAVDKIDLRVERGELFGLIGPYGSGKAILMRMLAGLDAPTSGTARVNGYDIIGQNHLVRQSAGFAESLDAVSGDPAVLFIDEPAVNILSFIKEQLVVEQRRTVVVATCRLSAARICDRIAVMNKGRIIAYGSLDSLESVLQPSGIEHGEIEFLIRLASNLALS